MNHPNLLLCAEHHRLTGMELATQARELRRAGLRAQARQAAALAATHQRWADDLRLCADALLAAAVHLQPATELTACAARPAPLRHA